MQQIPSATNVAEAEACAAQLIEIVPLIMRTIRALMRSHSAAELSVSHFRALHYVKRHPDCSLSALAEHVGLSVPAASRMIDALVNDQLIERELLASDRRYVALHLSEHGSHILQSAQTGALQSLTAMLAPLSEVERDAIVQALEPLRAIFSANAAQAEEAAQTNADGGTERTL